MKIVCAMLTVLILLPGVQVGSVASVASQNDRTVVLRPVINESGWKIPGLEESHITSARQELPKRYGATGVSIHVTVFKPKREFITTIPVYRLKNGESLIVRERKVLIDSIIKCDVNNRTFDYIVQATVILEEGGRTGYAGMFGVHYSDRDGDGKFEAFEEGPPFVTPEVKIPDWVLANP